MKINIKNLEQKISIGIYPHEKILKTKVLITLEIFLKNQETIIDYDVIIKTICEIASSKHFNYVEELATEISNGVKDISQEIIKIKTKIQKCIFTNFIEEISVEVVL